MAANQTDFIGEKGQGDRQASVIEAPTGILRPKDITDKNNLGFEATTTSSKDFVSTAGGSKQAELKAFAILEQRQRRFFFTSEPGEEMTMTTGTHATSVPREKFKPSQGTPRSV